MARIYTRTRADTRQHAFVFASTFSSLTIAEDGVDFVHQVFGFFGGFLLVGEFDVFFGRHRAQRVLLCRCQVADREFGLQV